MREYSVLKMFSKELNREVRVFISLPKSYRKSIKKYPVLYMHDGHNLFDDKQATFGKSWGILETFEEKPGLPEIIIVGIETIHPNRNFDLVPFNFKFEEEEVIYGGNTDIYYDFMINSLKPYIDQTYRTFQSPKNTGVMGSSFGGVASTYAALKYSKYFSMFGCVSNAYFVIQEDMMKLAKEADVSGVKKMWMDVGTKETSNSIDNKRYVESNQAIYDILKDKLDPTQLKFVIAEGAIHNEKDWEERFPEIIQFLFNH